MRIAVLGSAGSWHAQDLTRAARGRHEIVPVSYQRIHSSVATQTRVSAADVCLNHCDAVLVRTMPPGSLEQVIFRMDALSNLLAAGVKVVNPPRAIEIAVDKYLATTRLAAAGLLVPRTMVCQSAQEALQAYAELGNDVVVKPLFGSEGRGIERLSDSGNAEHTLKTLADTNSVIYLQEFIPHEGCDLRLLVIGDEVLGMKRCNHFDWRTNISRGAAAQPLTVTDELAHFAIRSAAAVGATIAGVDVLPARDGSLYAIEVNAVPGWHALSTVTEADIAELVLRQLY